MLSPTLTDATQRTYQTFVGDASTLNAPWSDVRALLAAIAELTVGDSGNLTAIRNGHVLTLHPALTKDIAESGEATALRRFLQNSEIAPVAMAGRDPHLLLVIQGATARLYRCLVIGGIPQLVVPYEASEPNPEERKVRPTSPPKSAGVFAAMAEELQAAGQILILGTAAGNEAATFAAWLSQHDSELSRRILGTGELSEETCDNASLLAAARRFYATRTPSAC